VPADEIAASFPLLTRRVDGEPIVYLDSAATTLKPISVLDSERRYATEFTANVHRGMHLLSSEATFAFEAARRQIAAMFCVPPVTVVFTAGATDGLNMVARGLGLTRDDLIVAPVGEHHANILPWMDVSTFRSLPLDLFPPTRPLDLSLLDRHLAAVRPRVFTFAHGSHVTGVIQPADEICRIAARHGVITVMDAAQTAAHISIDIGRTGCDFLEDLKSGVKHRFGQRSVRRSSGITCAPRRRLRIDCWWHADCDLFEGHQGRHRPR
jgi:cysteine desulfurase/selenocysteine lyase